MTIYPIARLGDTSTHGGAIITSAQRAKCEGQLIARVTDILDCPEHGPNPIVTGSPKYKVEGQLTARGDGGGGSETACGAVIIGGAVRAKCE